MRNTHAREGRLVTELCAYLSLWDGALVGIESFPDREPEGAGACDAIIQRATGRWAVEHTRVFTRPQAPKHYRVIDGIRPIFQEAFASTHPTLRVWALVRVEEFDESPASMERARRLASTCADAIVGKKPKARVQVPFEGQSPAATVDILGHGASSRCHVSPGIWGADPESRHPEDMRRALQAKREKMSRYRVNGYRTLLLLDSDEIVWPSAAIKAFTSAYEIEGGDGYDEIYMAESDMSPSLIYPLKLGDRCPVWQPELGDFIGLQQRVEERLGFSE